MPTIANQEPCRESRYHGHCSRRFLEAHVTRRRDPFKRPTNHELGVYSVQMPPLSLLLMGIVANCTEFAGQPLPVRIRTTPPARLRTLSPGEGTSRTMLISRALLREERILKAAWSSFTIPVSNSSMSLWRMMPRRAPPPTTSSLAPLFSSSATTSQFARSRSSR